MPENDKTGAERKPRNKGGRPPKPLDIDKLMARPEMQEFLQRTIASAISAVGGPASVEVPVPATAAAPGTADWASSLAMAIVQAGDPKRKPLDPKVIEQRQRARARMNSLIAAAVANIKKFNDAGDYDAAAAATPEYELTREIYVEEQLIQATYMGADRVVRRTRIGWTKAPGQAYMPVNAVAHEIKAAYLESVGGVVTEGKMPDREVGASLSVYQDGKLVSVPTKRAHRGGIQEGGALSLRGQNIPGAVIETNVLGTRAAPARQLA